MPTGHFLQALRLRAPKVNRSICNLFRKARTKPGLPKPLVSTLRDTTYGTRILMRTGNLCSRNERDGARDITTALHDPHPELKIVGVALDYRGYETFCVTARHDNLGSLPQSSQVNDVFLWRLGLNATSIMKTIEQVPPSFGVPQF